MLLFTFELSEKSNGVFLIVCVYNWIRFCNLYYKGWYKFINLWQINIYDNQVTIAICFILLLGQSKRTLYWLFIIMRLANKCTYETVSWMFTEDTTYTGYFFFSSTFVWMMCCSCIIVFRYKHNFSLINPK